MKEEEIKELCMDMNPGSAYFFHFRDLKTCFDPEDSGDMTFTNNLLSFLRNNNCFHQVGRNGIKIFK